MTFRQQHQSLMQFGGTLSMLKGSLSDEEKLERILAAWEPEILECMAYWLAVCYDTEAVPFNPIPFKKGGTNYKEDPITTPMELVDMLDGGLNAEEAEAVLEEMEKNMFRPAYETFRRILTRDLSSLHLSVELADRLALELIY